MSVSTSFKLVALLAACSIIYVSCQKQVDDLRQDPPSLNSSSAQVSLSSNKQDRKILLVSNRDGNDEIYAMDTDGSNLVRLTYNNVPDGRATWSANGQHIAFASGSVGSRDIFIMNANGQGLRNLTNTPNFDEDWPEWSPRGNRIIFASNRDGNFELYVSDMDGEEITRLTYRPLTDDRWGTYSPDGSKIAFQSDLGITSGRTDVFTMNSDGSNVIRLTNSSAFDQMPTWSPDGSKIAFMSARDGNPEVYVMNWDGSSQTRLTNTTAIDARPSWSREGLGIAFTSGRDFALPSTLPKFEIYLMNGDGTQQRRITNNAVYDDYPFIK